MGPKRREGSARPKLSAGILLYRLGDGPNGKRSVEVFLAHPGGPFWAEKDLGIWTIPKGEPNPDEPAEDAARREFREEIGFDPAGELEPLGDLRQPPVKVVTAFALEFGKTCELFVRVAERMR